MTQQISTARVIGKSQNRTALGMMNAYVKKYPNTTPTELNTTFSKKKVCPDTGIDQLFYTPSEIEQEKLGSKAKWFTEGNACFVDDGEWLTLGNGQKVAFNKVWTAQSLALLQAEMAKHQIFGEVDKSCKGNNGYMIAYEYKQQFKQADNEPQATGVPIWVWLIAFIVLLALAFFGYQHFMK